MTSNYWLVPAAGYCDPLQFKGPNWRLMLALSLNLAVWMVLLLVVF